MIAMTIESRVSPETAKISVSYKGSDFKCRFEKRKKLVQIFSNEALKRCTDKVF